MVAGQQEARQRCRENHGITHYHVGRTLASPVLAPGYGNDSNGARKVRNVERDLSGSVSSHIDDAGEHRHRWTAWRIALQLRAFITAGANLAAGALHAVDQIAVEIADFCREPPLSEVIIACRRRLIICQV